MDSVHDLGGKQGFGAVDVSELDVPFHHDWEGRMWAMSRLIGARGWTIDWWRHVRETQQPEQYLTRPYYDSWAMTFLVALVDAGDLTLAEIASGTAQGPIETPAELDRAGVVEAVRKAAFRFDHAIDAAPKFQPGDTVRTRKWTTDGHTRLPAYARDRPGVIHAHNGAHEFADDSARGIEGAQHLYSVRFEARDLWPEAADSHDCVYLDLWESYFEQP